MKDQTERATSDMKLWLFELAHGNLKEKEIIAGFLKHYAIHGIDRACDTGDSFPYPIWNRRGCYGKGSIGSCYC